MLFHRFKKLAVTNYRLLSNPFQNIKTLKHYHKSTFRLQSLQTFFLSCLHTSPVLSVHSLYSCLKKGIFPPKHGKGQFHFLGFSLHYSLLYTNYFFCAPIPQSRHPSTKSFHPVVGTFFMNARILCNVSVIYFDSQKHR